MYLATSEVIPMKAVCQAEKKEIVVKFKVGGKRGRCGLCGKPAKYPPGLALFLDGTEQLVCTDCGHERALELRDCVWEPSIDALVSKFMVQDYKQIDALRKEFLRLNAIIEKVKGAVNECG